MGSVMDYGELCPICGKQNLLGEYFYKSDEKQELCEACGYWQSLFLLRTKEGHAIFREMARYPIDGTAFLVSAQLESRDEIERVPIRPDMTEQDIYSYLNDWAPDVLRGIYLGCEDRSFFNRFSRFSIQKADDTPSLVIRMPIWQLRAHAVNSNGKMVRITPYDPDWELRGINTPPERDLYKFAVGDPRKESVQEFIVPSEVMYDGGTLDLIQNPGKLSGFDQERSCSTDYGTPCVISFKHTKERRSQ